MRRSLRVGMEVAQQGDGFGKFGGAAVVAHVSGALIESR